MSKISVKNRKYGQKSKIRFPKSNKNQIWGHTNP